jgi:large subunit ribosomal protein L6
MSRIGKKPVEIVKGVEVSVSGQTVKVKGPKGAVERQIHDSMTAVVEVMNTAQLMKSAVNAISLGTG